MLIPAIVIKIVGFVLPDGSLSKKPVPTTNVVRVTLDNGNIQDINYYSGNKNKNVLSEFLENKATLGVKSNKKKELVADLMMDDSGIYEKFIEKNIQSISAAEPHLKGNALRKRAIEDLAQYVLYNRALFQSGSIIRSAYGVGNDGKSNVKGITTAYKEGKLSYGTSGMYAHATLPHQIPVELIAANKNGKFLGFYSINTSPFITKESIHLLLGHLQRTIVKRAAENKPNYLPYILNIGNIKKEQDGEELAFYLDRMNEISKINRGLEKGVGLDPALSQEYIGLLQYFEGYLKARPNLYPLFKMNLPLSCPPELLKRGILTVSADSGKSPFQVFRNAIVNLNYSAEDPAVKDMLKQYILDYFLKFVGTEQYTPKLLLTYNIAGNSVIGPGISWGFMADNLDFSKLTLGIDDSINIYNYTDQYLQQIKSQQFGVAN